MTKLRDLTGQRFGRLVAVKRDITAVGRVRWLCHCKCGSQKSIANNKLLTGNTKSCGCLNSELSSKRQRTRNTGCAGSKHPMYGKTGKRNPNYGRRKRNPKTPETLIARMRSDYSIWRKSIFVRDNYTCQSCFQRGGELNAHHIEGFANNPDVRFDVSNGICFCVECHKRFHVINGKTNVTKKQLSSFLHDGTV